MSRTAAFFTTVVIAFGLMAAALIADVTWLIALACLALGASAFFFAREMADAPSSGFYDWFMPSDPGKRRVVMRVCGGLLMAAGAFVLVSELG